MPRGVNQQSLAMASPSRIVRSINMFVLVTLVEATENLISTYSYSMQLSSFLTVGEYGGMIELVKPIRDSICFDTSRKVA